MEQNQRLSKPLILFIGIAFIGIGVVTTIMGLNLLASILLILVGLAGIIGSIFGVFEEV